jgi:hypothetical protein
MRQNRVAVDAVAEGDELKAVDDDDVAGRKNYVIHKVCVEERGAADAARKSPIAGKMNRVPGCDKSRSQT